MHTYFPNGIDFHIQFPFKVKKIWKLRDGIMLEKLTDDSVNTSNSTNNINSNKMSLFTLSNPYDELKPVLCRSSNDSNKNIFSIISGLFNFSLSFI
jgi:hypothetical protein